jgi:hypothetical protein
MPLHFRSCRNNRKNGPVPVRAAKMAIDETLESYGLSDTLEFEKKSMHHFPNVELIKKLNDFNNSRQPAYVGK